MAFDFSLLTTGLQTPRLVDARERVVQLWKAAYGEDCQTGSDSPDGLLIDTLSILLDLLWQGNGAIWASSFFRTAQGVALDWLLDLVGKIRRDAQPSTVSAVWYGDDASTVPTGSIASVDDTGVRFESVSAGTTGATDTCGVVVIETSTDATYRVTVNGNDYDEVAVGETIEEIRDALIDAINAGAEPVTAISGGLAPTTGFGVIVIDADDGTTAFTLAASIAAGSGTITARDAVRISMESSEDGPFSASATLLRTIETSVSGIDGVTTTADASPGRIRESDEDFRARHLDTLNSEGSASLRAIRARILNDVDDVLFCRGRENRDDVVDANGLPPHSYEMIVLGGEDEDIAATIYEAGPAGIQTWGNTTEIVVDEEDEEQPISFTRAAERYLHLEITVTTGEGFAAVGDPEAAIAQAVAAYLERGGAGQLDPGTNLYRFQLGVPINSIPGITGATIETDDTPDPGDAPVFSAADIAVGDDEILIADSSRITVIVT